MTEPPAQCIPSPVLQMNDYGVHSTRCTRMLPHLAFLTTRNSMGTASLTFSAHPSGAWTHQRNYTMPGRKEDVEPHRAEIEDLTLNGHNCEQIAAALRAKGLEISAKTISRYRVSWGIRKRAEPKTKGRTCKQSRRRRCWGIS